VIADAEGKGVASALMMASVRAHAAYFGWPRACLRKIGQVDEQNYGWRLADSKALSMFFGVLDHRRLGFHYINAGHVPLW